MQDQLDVNDDNNNDNDNDNYDQLELCGLKIVYETSNSDIVEPKLRDFVAWEVGEREIDEDDEEDASVLVELDADISREKAIGTLKTIIAHIEAHGLPPTSRKLPRNVALLVKKMENTNPDGIRELVHRLVP